MLLLATAMASSSASAAEEPMRADFCTVVQQPERFAGRIVEVRALQTKLKSGEWGLLGDCWPPVLLAFPKDLSPRPDFTLEESSALEMLLAARNERVSFKATFVGRFDWNGERPSADRRTKRRPFGKSKLSMRFVLQRVADPETIVLPYK
jgi:hypothetical protein